MLAEVFGPGADEKCFDVDIWMFDIAEDSPARCAVSTPDSPVLVHRPQKLCRVLLIDEVLDRHEHGALLKRRRDVLDDRRYAPVVPRTHIGGCVGQPRHESQRRRRDRPEAGPQERRFDARARTDASPHRTARGHPSLRDEHKHREHASSNPVRRQILYERADE